MTEIKLPGNRGLNADSFAYWNLDVGDAHEVGVLFVGGKHLTYKGKDADAIRAHFGHKLPGPSPLIDTPCVQQAGSEIVKVQREKLKKLLLSIAAERGPGGLPLPRDVDVAFGEVDTRVANTYRGEVIPGEIEDCDDSAILANYIAAAEEILAAEKK
jgi:hypothetical protein